MRGMQAGDGGRQRAWVQVLVIIVFAGIALLVPATRVLFAMFVAFVGPIAVYGGLIAFLRGRLGVRSARHIFAGLVCGTATPLVFALALTLEWTFPLALLGVSCSVLAVFFAIAGFSRERTAGARDIPPVETEEG